MAAVSEHTSGKRLVLAPREALVAGGPAEECEQRMQALLRSGYRQIVVDLSQVPTVDSAGIRTLVRCHTTAQRMDASFALVRPNARVRSMLELAHLGSVFTIHESLEAARARQWPWGTIRFVIGGAFVCLALWWAGREWPQVAAPTVSGDTGGLVTGESPPVVQHPFVEVSKLVAAAFIGLLVTGVQRRLRREKPFTQAMEHAQVLLCVSGAAIMMIIGNSLARAFGIAGAASIIRFRTPVEDPKDITILFLLMALGMASGLGLFAVAGLGTAFLCVLLAVLDYVGARQPRVMMVEIEAKGREFPVAHVQSVFARNRVVFEPREISQGDEAVIEYHTTMDPGVSLEDLSAQLMAGDAGVQSVSWKPPKRSD
jgi:anti-anti-sigma factor